MYKDLIIRSGTEEQKKKERNALFYPNRGCLFFFFLPSSHSLSPCNWANVDVSIAGATVPASGRTCSPAETEPCQWCPSSLPSHHFKEKTLKRLLAFHLL